MKNVRTKEPLPGLNVNLVMFDGTKIASGLSKTDAEGFFGIQFDKEVYGEHLVDFVVTDAKDKRQRVNIILNRTFRPDPVTYEPLQLRYEQPQSIRQEEISREPETFTWTDTLPKIHYLGEVRVKEKLLSRPGSRYTYLGGEDAGKRYSTLYYNIQDEMEKIMDEGGNDMSIWDLLKKRNPYFEYDFEVPAQPGEATHLLRYKNRSVILLLDNKTPIREENEYLASEIQSLMIVDDAERIPLFVPEGNNVDFSNFSQPPVLFLLYSNISGTVQDTKKGMRKTILHGFSKAEDFYSPNYRMEAKPSESDKRRTLYWNPAIETDKKGKANVILFSNSRKDSRIHVNAQGIAVNGQMFGTK